MVRQRIVFRADSSDEIGTGHVLRCLTLALELQAQGSVCRFICGENAASLASRIQAAGHEICILPASKNHFSSGDGPVHEAWLGCDWRADAEATISSLTGELVDWIVIDHYAVDERWERMLRPYCRHMMVIDDLADRRHECDLLLDQNMGRNSTDYDELVPRHARRLIGSNYTLLRREFAAHREIYQSRRHADEVPSIVVTMGGVDKLNATSVVLQSIRALRFDRPVQIVVAMGKDAPWAEEVRRQADSVGFPCRVLVDVEGMANLLSESEIAISASGGTAWELCSLGVPSILVAVAENQVAIAQSLARAGAAIVTPLIETEIGFAVQLLMSDSALRDRLSRAAYKITDGIGAIRVAKVMVETE